MERNEGASVTDIVQIVECGAFIAATMYVSIRFVNQPSEARLARPDWSIQFAQERAAKTINELGHMVISAFTGVGALIYGFGWFGILSEIFDRWTVRRTALFLIAIVIGLWIIKKLTDFRDDLAAVNKAPPDDPA